MWRNSDYIFLKENKILSFAEDISDDEEEEEEEAEHRHSESLWKYKDAPGRIDQEQIPFNHYLYSFGLIRTFMQLNNFVGNNLFIVWFYACLVFLHSRIAGNCLLFKISGLCKNSFNLFLQSNQEMAIIFFISIQMHTHTQLHNYLEITVCLSRINSGL